MIDDNTNLNFENFSLTARAESYLRQAFRASGCSGAAGLRLVVRSEGWAGLAGQLTAETAPQAGDRTFKLTGFQLFVPAGSQELLDGVWIDTSESFGRVRLSFLDPRLLSHAQAEQPARASEKTQS